MTDRLQNIHLMARFWSKVTLCQHGAMHCTSCCWPWHGSTHEPPRNYGKFYFRSRYDYAHRVAYIMAYGEIPDGMLVLHHCDNPPCVRPAHLFLGTHKDNLDDAKSKGRFHGTDGRKLTWQDVTEIRALAADGMKHVSIARQYGIGQPHIFRIVHNLAWKEENRPQEGSQ